MNLMPEVGFLEIVVIAVIALVVVGPKDLPKLMRMAGRFAAQARRMASEFNAAFSQMARETEMEEMRQEIESLKRNNPVAEARRALDEVTAPIDAAMRETADEARAAAEGDGRKPAPAAEAPAP